MYDPFSLPRRFVRTNMRFRTFATPHGPLPIWSGLVCKDGESNQPLQIWSGLECKDVGTNHAHVDIYGDCYTVLWHLRGKQTYRDETVGEITASAGDLLCRLPNRRHSTIPVAGSGLVEFFLDVGGDWYRRLSAHSAVPEFPHALLGWNIGLADRCLSFLGLLPKLPDASWPLVLAEAQGILAEFAVRSSCSGVPDPVIDHACAILASDLPSRLSLAEVARRVGIGKESFRKRFTAATGESPGQWRIHRRMDAACGQLRMNVLSISEIARDLGYPDTPSFTKQFRHMTGQSPAAWRRGRQYR